MSDLVLVFVIVSAVIAAIVLALRALFAFLDGVLHVRFPRVSEGDWRDGLLRRAWIAGVAFEERKAVVVEQRKRIAEQRAAEERDREA